MIPTRASQQRCRALPYKNLEGYTTNSTASCYISAAYSEVCAACLGNSKFAFARLQNETDRVCSQDQHIDGLGHHSREEGCYIIVKMEDISVIDQMYLIDRTPGLSTLDGIPPELNRALVILYQRHSLD
jgi:hypothetical protein